MADTIYNEVTYPSAVYAQTHPDRLAMMALLFGMKPASAGRCRVLELGCGDGWNLITMAYGLPESEFVGIDLASEPIARGTALAEKLALRNVSLREMDVADAADLGEFDYIIAHGLYSWVPGAVREKIMELCGRSLAANGVAYLSYNAYPGNHMRDMVRGMMRYHTAHFTEPEQKIRQARGLVKFIAESKEPPEIYHQLMGQEFERVSKYTDAGLFHDDLSSINQPFYFHEFMAQAAPHGLQFLAEADMSDNRPGQHPPQVQAVLAGLDPRDIVGRQQYLDFLRCRAFRQTLLCRSGVALEREVSPERAYGMRMAGEIRAASATPDLRSPTAEIFYGPQKAEIETDRPLVKTAFAKLGALWPKCIHFRELLAHSRAELGRSGANEAAEDAENLAVAMTQAHGALFIEFRTHQPQFVTEPGEKPRASALARLQLASGDRLTTMLHQIVRIQDPLGRELLRLMDGTRDRSTLKAELGLLASASESRTAAEKVSLEELDENIRHLARLGLLLE
ncbi:MAG: class I SAM-dependent methyltransferase [Chthoniobacteraceae bacterium]